MGRIPRPRGVRCEWCRNLLVFIPCSVKTQLPQAEKSRPPTCEQVTRGKKRHRETPHHTQRDRKGGHWYQVGPYSVPKTRGGCWRLCGLYP